MLALHLVLAISPVEGKELLQLRGAIHTYSNFSSGQYAIIDLASQALAEGLEVLIITDHDLLAAAWGPPPLRYLIRRKEELPSVLARGVEPYYRAMAEARERFPGLVIIPGITTSPYYYFEGSYFKGTLLVRDWRREMLVLGLKPQDLRSLPVLHNGPSSRYLRQLLPGTAFFLISAILGIILLTGRRFFRVAGAVIFAGGILMAINDHPFRSSPFDQYHGDLGPLPYQELIDYANDRGGLVLWARQDDTPRRGRLGSFRTETPASLELLFRTRGWVALDALHDGGPVAARAGGEWDALLERYIRGTIPAPVWAYGGVNFRSRKERGGLKRLSDVQTVFLVRKKGAEDVLRALSRGKMYAVRGYEKNRLKLEEFRVEGEGGTGTMGDEVGLKGPPHISFRISSEDESERPVVVSLIARGRVVRRIEGRTPLSLRLEDEPMEPGTVTYYRLEVRADGEDILLSNPIFIRFETP